jgi:hypothetical protein
MVVLATPEGLFSTPSALTATISKYHVPGARLLIT